MNRDKAGWVERTAPYAPFVVLLVVVLVAWHHIVFYW